MTPAELRAKEESRRGDDLGTDSAKLLAFYRGCGRQIVKEYLAERGLGRPHQRNVVMLGSIRRLVHALSVLYAGSPTRFLSRGGSVLPPTDRASEALRSVYRECKIDACWGQIDAHRILLKTALVEWSESKAHRGIVPRIFAPHQYFRDYSLAAADVPGEDSMIALLLSDAPRHKPEDAIYRVWRRMDDGAWVASVETGKGVPIGAQPFRSDAGVSPLPVLPIQLVTDEPLISGEALHAVPQPRLDTSLSVDAQANDAVHLLEQEASSRTVVSTEDALSAAAAFRQAGPGATAFIPREATASVLEYSPKISEASALIDQMLSHLAMSECLPPDSFSKSRQAMNAQALRVSERDLDRRRKQLAVHAADQEREAYRILAAITGVYGQALGLDELDADADLSVIFSTSWQPSDAQQEQALLYREIAVGARSKAEAVASLRGCSIQDAEALLELIAMASPDVDAAQMLGLADAAGPRLSTGEDSVDPGNIAGSQEGASVVSAIR